MPPAVVVAVIAVVVVVVVVSATAVSVTSPTVIPITSAPTTTAAPTASSATITSIFVTVSAVLRILLHRAGAAGTIVLLHHGVWRHVRMAIRALTIHWMVHLLWHILRWIPSTWWDSSLLRMHPHLAGTAIVRARRHSVGHWRHLLRDWLRLHWRLLHLLGLRGRLLRLCTRGGRIAVLRLLRSVFRGCDRRRSAACLR